MNTQVQDQDDDPEIRAAYERLGSALDGPVDVLDRVERRMTARRRRHVATYGGATVVALGAVGTLTVFAVSGGDPSGTYAADQPAPRENTLSITRMDGSTYTFHDVKVSCALDPATGVQVISAASPRAFTGNQAVEPFFMFDAQLDKVAGGHTFTLPVDSASGSSDDRPMILFFASDEGKARSNELSSAESGSSGTVQVLSASCGATPRLELAVDATLDSEVEQVSMKIAGDLY